MSVNVTEKSPDDAVAVTDSVQAELNARRPKRADARRNYDSVVAAARASFAEAGSAASLEEIARRAGVGIGTLYRNFPNRQALLEAVYLDEVAQLCESTTAFSELAPWDAFEAFCRRLVGYLRTKQALASELLDYVGRDAQVFTYCRGSLFTAGEPLLRQAQAAQVVRADVELPDLIHLLGGIAKIHGIGEEQAERLLSITLDGLRSRQPA